MPWILHESTAGSGSALLTDRKLNAHTKLLGSDRSFRAKEEQKVESMQSEVEEAIKVSPSRLSQILLMARLGKHRICSTAIQTQFVRQ